MRKRTFVIFGVLLAFLAVLIPLWAFSVDGSDEAGERSVSADLEEGKELFETNCGNCHVLYVAGTAGNFGPNLDDQLAPTGPPTGDAAQDAIDGTTERVLAAIENGFQGNDRGRMPAGILSGEQAEEVARFVATVAGRG